MITDRPFVLFALAAVLLLAGCAPRTVENAKAAIQNDQAVRATAKVLTSPEFTDPIVTLGEEDRAKVLAAMRKMFTLLQSADASIQPVIARLSIGVPRADLEVPTTEDQAIADPDAFARLAAGQTALAKTETEEAQKSAAFVAWIKALAIGIGDSWLAKLGLGAGTLGLVIGGATKLAQVYRANRSTIDSLRTAFTQTVSGLDDARARLGDTAWDAHVAPALEAAQDEKVKHLVSRIQTPGADPKA